MAAASAFALRAAQAQNGAGSDFTVAGNIDNLYPGLHATLDAVVTNPQSVDLMVTAVEVSTSDAGSACPASLLSFGTVVESDTIAPGETGIVQVPVRVATETPDACQGVSWPLEFAAQAVALDREPDGGATPPDPGAATPSGNRDEPSRGALAFTGTVPGHGVLAAIVLLMCGLLVRRMTRHRR